MNRTMTFLAVGFLLAGCTGPRASAPAAASAASPLKVAVYADRGPSGVGALEWYRIVRDSPEMELKLVDGKAVAAGALEGQDLFVMPGGSSSKEFESLGPKGVERMKDYIRGGGAYLGTCAGCCLLMDGERRARLMPWNTRGSEKDLFFPNVRITAAGAKALGIQEGNHRVRYHGGPFMWPTTNVIEGASFELWGTVNSECTYTGAIPKAKKMMGSAAVLGGTYGKGRVFVTSMHPEYFEVTHYLVKAAIRYLTGRDVTIPRPARRRGDLAVGYSFGAGTGIPAAEDALEVAAMPGVDLQVINGDDIVWADRLMHLDVFAAPQGITRKSGSYRALENFIARGGTYLTCERSGAPKGALVCANRKEMIRKIKELAN